MGFRGWDRLAALMGAALIGAGCGQAGSTGAEPQTATAHARVHRESGSTGDLLYVVTGSGTEILTYPDGQKIGTLEPKGWLGIACPDERSGDIYFDNTQELFKYAHGGTKMIGQLGYISDYYSDGCAVDPSTHDVAITYGKIGTSNHGFVGIYHGGSGSPSEYTIPNMTYYYYCGYDNASNLFCDGYGTSGFVFAELSKGSSKFIDISLDKTVELGQVQWDGNYMTIARPQLPLIYQISVSGSTGTVAGTTSLTKNKNEKRSTFARTWISGNTVVGGYWTDEHAKFKDHVVGLWNYPEGGAHPYKTLSGLTKGKKDQVSYLAISLAPSH